MPALRFSDGGSNGHSCVPRRRATRDDTVNAACVPRGGERAVAHIRWGIKRGSTLTENRRSNNSRNYPVPQPLSFSTPCEAASAIRVGEHTRQSLPAAMAPSAVAGMRGLNIFIQDVRNATNKEFEQSRVQKELANIRTKFKNSKELSAYDKKKCVPIEVDGGRTARVRVRLRPPGGPPYMLRRRSQRAGSPAAALSGN